MMPGQNQGAMRPDSPAMTELVLARSIGLFSLLLIFLALPDLLQNTGQPQPAGYVAFILAIPACTLATMVPRDRSNVRRFFAGAVAVLLLAGFLLWHLGVVGDGASPEARPWSWGIAGAGVGMAGVAGNIRWSGTYGVVFSVLVFLVPAMPAGSHRSWYNSWQDALLTLVMTAVIAAPIWALRRAVLESDRAAEAAVTSFAEGARADAVAVERLRLDALTHDIIMSTLTVAAQARVPEVQTAARMAAVDALEQLRAMKNDGDASDHGDLTIQSWLAGLGAATATYGAVLIVPEPLHACPKTVPAASARSIRQAATEAVRNSSKYAPGSSTTVTVTFTEPGGGRQGITVEITDHGPGFEVTQTLPERLGVRVSIIERMRDAGGCATLVSEPGHGTTVRLTWSPLTQGPQPQRSGTYG